MDPNSQVSSEGLCQNNYNIIGTKALSDFTLVNVDDDSSGGSFELHMLDYLKEYQGSSLIVNHAKYMKTLSSLSAHKFIKISAKQMIQFSFLQYRQQSIQPILLYIDGSQVDVRSQTNSQIINYEDSIQASLHYQVDRFSFLYPHTGSSLKIELYIDRTSNSRSTENRLWSVLDYDTQIIDCIANCQSCSISNPEICDQCIFGYNRSATGDQCILDQGCSFSDSNCLQYYSIEQYDNEGQVLFGIFLLVTIFVLNDYIVCFSLFYTQLIKLMNYKKLDQDVDVNFLAYIYKNEEWQEILDGKFILCLIMTVFIGLPVYLIGRQRIPNVKSEIFQHIYYFFVFNFQYALFFNYTNYIFDQNIELIKQTEKISFQAIAVMEIIITVFVHFFIAYSFTQYVIEKHKPKIRALNVNRGLSVSEINNQIFKLKFTGDLKELQILTDSCSEEINFSYAALLLVLRSLIFCIVKSYFGNVQVYVLFGINLYFMVFNVIIASRLQGFTALFLVISECNIFLFQLQQLMSLHFPKDTVYYEIFDWTEAGNILVTKYLFSIYIFFKFMKALKTQIKKPDVSALQKKKTLRINEKVLAIRVFTKKQGNINRYVPSLETETNQLSTKNLLTQSQEKPSLFMYKSQIRKNLIHQKEPKEKPISDFEQVVEID